MGTGGDNMKIITIIFQVCVPLHNLKIFRYDSSHHWRVQRLAEFLFQMSDSFGLVYDVGEGRVWV